MKDHFAMMAGYNGWANGRIYGAVAALPDEDYRRDLGAFFGSLHGTLNHILVADRIWMKRFTGAGEAPARLDAILFEEFEDLQDARRMEDERIAIYVKGLDDRTLTGRIRYRTISEPEDIEQPLAPALAHFFNHQTHHRGQAHALLTRLGQDVPSLDLMLYQRETGTGMN